MDAEWMNIEVPVPFMFNALKHHKGAIAAFIRNKTSGSPEVLREAAKQLVVIGSLVMDLYKGGLGINEIAADVSRSLQKDKVFHEPAYRNWITGAKKKFRTIDLSDGSKWTLLQGRDHGRYIHIHPARYSRHSLRIKALPLKTAILLMLAGKGRSGLDLIKDINNIRTTYLAESPIKDEREATNTLRILKVLRS